MIQLFNVIKNYGSGKPALDDISLKIDKGEFVSIAGPSGSGKTTILNIIGCLDKATSGKYYLDNENIN